MSFRIFNIGRMPYPVNFFILGAKCSAIAAIAYQTRFNSAQCFFMGMFYSEPKVIPSKYTYPANLKVMPPPSILNKNCSSIKELFAANPALVNLTRICADLSNLIYYGTDSTLSSKESLMAAISKGCANNPLLSQLELVDSWRDGAVFLHKESKLLFCVARGTEFQLTGAGLRDIINDSALLIGAPAQARLMSFITRVNEAKKLHPDHLIITTGHSLGGAIAHDYAMHHPDAYSIVFSPGGTSADRTNSGLEPTWMTSNTNIVAFKPSNDIITRWFDCPGITIVTEPSGHGIVDNPLVSRSFLVTTDNYDRESSESSYDQYKSKQSFRTTADQEEVQKPSRGKDYVSSQHMDKSSHRSSEEKAEKQQVPTPETQAAQSATGIITSAANASNPKLENPLLPNKTSDSIVRRIGPLELSGPQTIQEIRREKKQQLAESKKEYKEQKHALKNSMPRNQERKELIHREQEQKRERDQAIKDKASNQEANLPWVDHIRRQEESWRRQEEASAHQEPKVEGKSSQETSNRRDRSGPSPAQVVSYVAARVAADRISEARNTRDHSLGAREFSFEIKFPHSENNGTKKK